MTTEQKVTSLELSIALRDEGAKQESQLWWLGNNGPFELHEYPDLYIVQKKRYAAFDCAELLEGLPDCAFVQKAKKRYFSECGLGGGEWAKEAAEALGKLKLWCLREGHCK